MPEFIADTDGTVNDLAWDDLPEFVQGYIECILFTNTCSGISMVEWLEPENVADVEEGSADGCIPTDSGYGDFAPDAIDMAMRLCEQFQTENAALLAQAYGMPERTRSGPVPYTAKRAGNDFWYDQVGHGTGFKDRDLGDIGDALADSAREYGDVFVSFDPDEGSPTGYGYVNLS